MNLKAFGNPAGRSSSPACIRLLGHSRQAKGLTRRLKSGCGVPPQAVFPPSRRKVPVLAPAGTAGERPTARRRSYFPKQRNPKPQPNKVTPSAPPSKIPAFSPSPFAKGLSCRPPLGLAAMTCQVMTLKLHASLRSKFPPARKPGHPGISYEKLCDAVAQFIIKMTPRALPWVSIICRPLGANSPK